MSLNKIIEKINKDADTEAQHIIGQGQLEANEYMKRSLAELESHCGKLLAEGNAQAQQQKKQHIQIAALDARKQILKEKQALIAKVFSQALEKLINMDDAAYSSVISNMLVNYPLTGDEEIITSAAGKKRLGDNFIKRLNNYLISKGKTGNCKWSNEHRELKGGFVIRRGKVEVNCSFEALIKSKQDDLEQEIALILFS